MLSHESSSIQSDYGSMRWDFTDMFAAISPVPSGWQLILARHLDTDEWCMTKTSLGAGELAQLEVPATPAWGSELGSPAPRRRGSSVHSCSPAGVRWRQADPLVAGQLFWILKLQIQWMILSPKIRWLIEAIQLWPFNLDLAFIYMCIYVFIQLHTGMHKSIRYIYLCSVDGGKRGLWSDVSHSETGWSSGQQHRVFCLLLWLPWASSWLALSLYLVRPPCM